MRFTGATQCTAEILADLRCWHSDGLTHEDMRRALLVGYDVAVTVRTISNWLKGRIPSCVALPVGYSERKRNDVPRGTGRNRPLRFARYTGSHQLRAPFRGGVYSIGHHHGRKGMRYLCWWFPEGVHQFDRDGIAIAGGPPDGLFTMRKNLREARADAVHHARTGEIRP